jgi:hypothetical protein
VVGGGVHKGVALGQIIAPFLWTNFNARGHILDHRV